MTYFILGLILGVCLTILIIERFKVTLRNIHINVSVDSKEAIKDLKEMELAIQKFKKENNLL